jgi:hypothetical protein
MCAAGRTGGELDLAGVTTMVMVLCVRARRERDD